MKPELKETLERIGLFVVALLVFGVGVLIFCGIFLTSTDVARVASDPIGLGCIPFVVLVLGSIPLVIGFTGITVNILKWLIPSKPELREGLSSLLIGLPLIGISVYMFLFPFFLRFTVWFLIECLILGCIPLIIGSYFIVNTALELKKRNSKF